MLFSLILFLHTSKNTLSFWGNLQTNQEKNLLQIFQMANDESLLLPANRSIESSQSEIEIEILARQNSEQETTATFRLQFRTVTGQLFPLQWDPVNTPPTTVTIFHLKQKLEAQYNIPSQFQRFIFRGRELNDVELVSQCHFEDQSVVHLILRQNPVTALQQPVINANQLNPLEAEEVKNAFNSSKKVVFCSIFDALTVVFWSFDFPEILLALPFALCGVASGIRCNQTYSSLYSLFVLFSLGFRCWITISISNQSQLSAVYSVFIALGFAIELWFLKVIVTFMSQLFKLSEVQKEELRRMRHREMNED